MCEIRNLIRSHFSVEIPGSSYSVNTVSTVQTGQFARWWMLLTATRTLTRCCPLSPKSIPPCSCSRCMQVFSEVTRSASMCVGDGEGGGPVNNANRYNKNYANNWSQKNAPWFHTCSQTRTRSSRVWSLFMVYFLPLLQFCACVLRLTAILQLINVIHGSYVCTNWPTSTTSENLTLALKLSLLYCICYILLGYTITYKCLLTPIYPTRFF